MVVKEVLQDLSYLENFNYKHAKDTITFIKMEQRRLMREIEVLSRNKVTNENKIIDAQFKLNLAKLALDQLVQGWIKHSSDLQQSGTTRKTSSNLGF